MPSLRVNEKLIRILEIPKPAKVVEMLEGLDSYYRPPLHSLSYPIEVRFYLDDEGRVPDSVYIVEAHQKTVYSARPYKRKRDPYPADSRMIEAGWTYDANYETYDRGCYTCYVGPLEKGSPLWTASSHREFWRGPDPSTSRDTPWEAYKAVVEDTKKSLGIYIREVLPLQDLCCWTPVPVTEGAKVAPTLTVVDTDSEQATPHPDPLLSGYVHPGLPGYTLRKGDPNFWVLYFPDGTWKAYPTLLDLAREFEDDDEGLDNPEESD